MGVAAFVVHGGDPLGDKELALLYFVCFPAAAALGAGGLEHRRLEAPRSGTAVQGLNPALSAEKRYDFQSCLALTFIVH